VNKTGHVTNEARADAKASGGALTGTGYITAMSALA
jgi:hypothetical protein